MASYDDEILIEDLEENFSDDPYSTATYVIRNIIHRALAKGGLMSEYEHANLITIEEVVRKLDNA
jgi:hypothetical protein